MFLFFLAVMTCRLCPCVRLAIQVCAALTWKMALLVVGGSLVHLSISCLLNLMIFWIVPQCISQHSLEVLESSAVLGEVVEPACWRSDLFWHTAVFALVPHHQEARDCYADPLPVAAFPVHSSGVQDVSSFSACDGVLQSLFGSPFLRCWLS